MKKRIALILIFALLAGMLAGCGAESEPDNILNVYLGGGVLSLDHALVTDISSFEVINCLLEGLTRLDEEGKVAPGMAESWEVSEDGLVYTFHLREAYWSNGDPVTAEDFVYGWQRLTQCGGGYSGFLYEGARVLNSKAVSYDGADPSILGVSAPDRRTFRVELEDPVAYFLALTSFTVFNPFNREFYESLEEGMYATGPDTMLSNGPFVLDKYIPGTSSIRLLKNELYWDSDNVMLDGIKFQVIESADNIITAFRAGALDKCGVGGNQLVSVKEDPELASMLVDRRNGYMNYLSINVTNEELASLNLRMAISYAIDRKSIINNVLKNGSVPAVTCVPDRFAYSSTTGEDFVSGGTYDPELCVYNPELALEYYEKAKSELGKDSFSFEMIGLTSGSIMLQAIKEQLESVLPGFELIITPMNSGEYFSALLGHEFQLALDGWGPDYADPMTFLGMWTSSSGYNRGLWSNEEYDELIRACTDSTYANDYDGRWEAMRKAARLLMADAAIVPLYYQGNSYLISDRVSGIGFHVAGITDYSRAVKVTD